MERDEGGNALHAILLEAVRVLVEAAYVELEVEELLPDDFRDLGVRERRIHLDAPRTPGAVEIHEQDAPGLVCAVEGVLQVGVDLCGRRLRQRDRDNQSRREQRETGLP